MRLLLSRLQRLPSLLLACANQLYRYLTAPTHGSLLAGTLGDLRLSRAQLLAENALLRHQLLILQRQVKRPHLNRRDRFWLLFLASHISNWKKTLVVIQPDTLLRWHRQGFRLFWRRKSRSKTNRPKIGQQTIDLIQRMARENYLWGAERIQGELLKLGIPVAKRTIQKYMRPVRLHGSGQTWGTFLKTHAQEIWTIAAPRRHRT